MSTILDALRRVESDRQRRDDSARNHANVIGTAPERPSHTRRMAPWLLGGAAGLVVIAIGAAVFVGLRSAPTLVAPAPASVATPAPVAVATRAPVVASRSADPIRGASSASDPDAVVPVYGVPSSDAPSPEAEFARSASGGALQSATPTAPPSVALPPVARQAAEPSRVSFEGAPPSADPIVRRPTPQVTSSPDARPIAALPVAPVSAEPAKVVQSVDPIRAAADPGAVGTPTRTVGSQATQATSAPGPSAAADRGATGQQESADVGVARPVAHAVEISIVRTVWHPSPDRRVAHLKIAGQSAPREVHEGDVVDGYEIGEIKLSGVVFLRDGVSIERRVGAR